MCRIKPPDSAQPWDEYSLYQLHYIHGLRQNTSLSSQCQHFHILTPVTIFYRDNFAPESLMRRKGNQSPGMQLMAFGSLPSWHIFCWICETYPCNLEPYPLPWNSAPVTLGRAIAMNLGFLELCCKGLGFYLVASYCAKFWEHKEDETDGVCSDGIHTLVGKRDEG